MYNSTKCEALSWLKEAGSHAFAGNRFSSTQDAIEFVQELYEAGATKVEVEVDDYNDADTLYITLPADLRKRLAIVPVVFNYRPDEFDDGWDGDDPIRIWWD